MRKDILGIDHVVILVRDIDAAQTTFSRLGFSLTPRGFHSIGTQNHCLMFESGYVELLTVKQPHPVTQYFTDFLATADGAAAIAYSTDDAQAAWASLKSSGIEADAPVDFSRPVELPGGNRDARFRVVQLPVAATPGCRSFLCQHFTPDVVWRSDYLEHPVGVTAIAGVSIVAEDAKNDAHAYGHLLEAKPVESSGGWTLPVGDASFDFTARGELENRLASVDLSKRRAPMLAALHLRVRDRARAEAAMCDGGFSPTRLADGSLAIGADQAHGVALIFA